MIFSEMRDDPRPSPRDNRQPTRYNLGEPRKALISLDEVSQVRIHNDHVSLASFSSRFVVSLYRHPQVSREAPLPVLETITRGRPLWTSLVVQFPISTHYDDLL